MGREARSPTRKWIALSIAADLLVDTSGLRVLADHRDPVRARGQRYCTCFVMMRKLRLRDALTADHHFAEAGFRGLLLL